MLACGGHVWMSSVFLNYSPLYTDPAAHWLARLSSKSQGYNHLCFPLSLPAPRYRHVPPCLAFLWVQGIQTQVLMLAWQALLLTKSSLQTLYCGLSYASYPVWPVDFPPWKSVCACQPDLAQAGRKPGHSGWVQEKRCLWSPIRQKLCQPCWIQGL